MSDLDPLSFVPDRQQKLVLRLLRRATEQSLRREAQALQRALSTGHAPTHAGRLSGQLARALTTFRGPLASQRLTAPRSEGGGRPFHFAHSVVTRSASTKSSKHKGGSSGGGRGIGGSGVSKAQAHVHYIERKDALEHALDARQSGKIEPSLAERIQSDQREPNQRSLERHDSGVGQLQSAQNYIENPTKAIEIGSIPCSFGTIGDTLEERLKFWELVDEHERGPTARLQNRLILELPHEASPESRLAIVRKFCAWFESRELPYWAALHAPGPDNDHRNYHAHLVFTERPSKRIPDPDHPGNFAWDFAITQKYTTSSRNVKTSHPYRRPRHSELRDRHAIRKLRHHFADVVNAELGRAQCKSIDGSPVRYDARSYSAMGYNVTPMTAIDRIVADKLKKGSAAVKVSTLRESVDRQAYKHAIRQKEELETLKSNDDALHSLAARPADAPHISKNLPSMLQVDLHKPINQTAVKVIGRKVLAAKRDEIIKSFDWRLDLTVLKMIIGATDPDRIARRREKTRNPIVLETLPDPADCALLHAAACDERRLLKLCKANAALERARRVWHAVLGSPLVTPAFLPDEMLWPQMMPTQATLANETRSGVDPSTSRAPQPDSGADAKGRITETLANPTSLTDAVQHSNASQGAKSKPPAETSDKPHEAKTSDIALQVLDVAQKQAVAMPAPSAWPSSVVQPVCDDTSEPNIGILNETAGSAVATKGPDTPIHVSPEKAGVASVDVPETQQDTTTQRPKLDPADVSHPGASTHSPKSSRSARPDAAQVSGQTVASRNTAAGGRPDSDGPADPKGLRQLMEFLKSFASGDDLKEFDAASLADGQEPSPADIVRIFNITRPSVQIQKLFKGQTINPKMRKIIAEGLSEFEKATACLQMIDDQDIGRRMIDSLMVRCNLEPLFADTETKNEKKANRTDPARDDGNEQSRQRDRDATEQAPASPGSETTVDQKTTANQASEAQDKSGIVQSDPDNGQAHEPKKRKKRRTIRIFNNFMPRNQRGRGR